MLRKLFILQLWILLFCLPTISHAYFIGYNPGTTYETSEINSTATAADMTGMMVTAVLSDGTEESISWGDLGASIYGVSGTGWSLKSTGDIVDIFGTPTAFGDWTLESTGAVINIININGEPGNTVFDIWDIEGDLGDGTYGTDGSLFGWYPKTIYGSTQFENFYFTYYNQVSLIGESPVGDLYRNLEIRFTNSLFQNSSMDFKTDTDLFVGGLNPVAPVPEPATMLLLGSGLIGLAGFRKRFKKN